MHGTDLDPSRVSREQKEPKHGIKNIINFTNNIKKTKEIDFQIYNFYFKKINILLNTLSSFNFTWQIFHDVRQLHFSLRF